MQPVAVAGHGDEVAVLAFGGLEDFRGRVAQRELRGDGQAFGAELGGCLFEVGAVGLHLLGLGKFEAVEIARDPAVGHVHEQQFRAQPLGQFGHVRQQAVRQRGCFRVRRGFCDT